jgi:hypothetical protein
MTATGCTTTSLSFKVVWLNQGLFEKIPGNVDETVSIVVVL